MSMQILPPAAGDASVRPKEETAGGERLSAKEKPGSSHGQAEADPIETKAAGFKRTDLVFKRRLKFEVDDESKKVTVKIIDTETDKVIRVLPPGELQSIQAQEAGGFLFDKIV